MRTQRLAIAASAGLFVAAAAWALHHQIAYVMASWICGPPVTNIWWISLVTLVMLAAGTLVSWWSLRTPPADTEPVNQFLRHVSLMAAALFLFAMLLQAGAVLLLPGCRG